MLRSKDVLRKKEKPDWTSGFRLAIVMSVRQCQ